jgi:hypothetical protein
MRTAGVGLRIFLFAKRSGECQSREPKVHHGLTLFCTNFTLSLQTKGNT